jgi:hypothetical protein
MGPKRICVFLPSPEVENRSSFWNFALISNLKSRTLARVHKRMALSVVLHRQNHLDYRRVSFCCELLTIVMWTAVWWNLVETYTYMSKFLNVPAAICYEPACLQTLAYISFSIFFVTEGNESIPINQNVNVNFMYYFNIIHSYVYIISLIRVVSTSRLSVCCYGISMEINFFIYNLNQQSKFTFYKLML